MSLAKRVRDYRFAKGWGPDELANRASISRTALYQIESGKTELPRAATLRRIAQALDVSMDVLLEDVDSSQVLGVRAKSRRLPAGHGNGNGGDFDRVGKVWDHQDMMEGPRPRPFDNTPFLRAPAGVVRTSPNRAELERKFRELLDSPLGDGLTKLVEEAHRFLMSSSLSPSL
jgi:transcriptional regulator with XRE-family HTH domain